MHRGCTRRVGTASGNRRDDTRCEMDRHRGEDALRPAGYDHVCRLCDAAPDKRGACGGRAVCTELLHCDFRQMVVRLKGTGRIRVQ